MPAAGVLVHERVERLTEGAARGLHRAGLALAEAERQRERAVGSEIDPCGLNEVALLRHGKAVRQPSRVRLELSQPIATLAGEAVRDRLERARGVERTVHRHRIVAVRGIGRRDRVRPHEQRVAAGARDPAAVGAAVSLAAAAVAVESGVEAHVEPVVAGPPQRLEARSHYDRRALRICHVVRDDSVAAALGGRGDAARERPVVERLDRVGHVARLQVGEGRPVGHHKLQRLVVGVVVGREVDVAEHAVRDGEPNLRAPVARRSDAVLACEVEVGEGAGAVRGGPGRRFGLLGHRGGRQRGEPRTGDGGEGEQTARHASSPSHSGCTARASASGRTLAHRVAP